MDSFIAEKKVFIPAATALHVHFGLFEPEGISLFSLVGLGAAWTHLYFRSLSGNSYCIFSPDLGTSYVLRKADNRRYSYQLTSGEVKSSTIVNGESFLYGNGGETTPVIEIVAINRKIEHHVSKVTPFFMPTTIHMPFDFMQQVNDTSGSLDPNDFAKTLMAVTRRAMRCGV